MDNKITIIEGPTPTFEPVGADWITSINETPIYSNIMSTTLRTVNGAGLVERCDETWAQLDQMYLHYRDVIGLRQKAPILAIRAIDSDEGQKLILWVRLSAEQQKQIAHFDE